MLMLKRTRFSSMACFLLGCIWLGSLLFSLGEANLAKAGEEEGGGFFKQTFQVIRWKGPTAILTSGQRFIITEKTKLLSANGKEEISIEDLPVPCKAEILYSPAPNRDPYALKILVIQALPGATTDWPAPVPE